MAAATSPATVLAELEGHPQRDALVARVREVALEAASKKDASALASANESESLSSDQAETRFGNAIAALRSPSPSEPERTLLGVLLCLGVAPDFPSAPESEKARAGELCFLAGHSGINALCVADAVLGEERLRPFWRAVAEVAKDRDRAQAMAALAALAAARSESARTAARELGEATDDPLTRQLFAREAAPKVGRIAGELSPPPRGPVGTLLLAVTGLLLVARGARLIGRIGLALKQPAELVLSERGLEVSHRTELLGRVLRSKETLIPMANLARVTREVRYPRLGLYLGLISLALGSYLGMGLLVDGARVPGGSLPLLGMGLLVAAIGLVVDYGITVLTDNVRGRCRIVVVPRKGRSVCVGALDPASADAMVGALASASASAPGAR